MKMQFYGLRLYNSKQIQIRKQAVLSIRGKRNAWSRNSLQENDSAFKLSQVLQAGSKTDVQKTELLIEVTLDGNEGNNATGTWDGKKSIDSNYEQ